MHVYFWLGDRTKVLEIVHNCEEMIIMWSHGLSAGMHIGVSNFVSYLCMYFA